MKLNKRSRQSAIAGAAGLTIMALAPAISRASEVVGYDVAGNNGGSASALAAHTVNGSVSAGGLSIGGGISSATANNSFRANNFVSADAATAFAANKYFTLNVTVSSGSTLSFTSLTETYYGSNSAASPGITGETLYYAINGAAGVSTGLGYTIARNGTTTVASPLDISGVAGLQSLTAGTKVQFYLVAYGGGAAGATFGVANLAGSTAAPDDLALFGNFTAGGSTGSGPSVEYFDTNGSSAGLGIAGGGSAPFSTSTTFNDSTGTGTPFTYSSTLPIVFNGTAGNVVVDAGGIATAGGAISFSQTGYVVSGGTVTLSAPTSISVDPGFTATISAALAGSGVTKSGLGTLILQGTNTYTGGTQISAGALQIDSDAELGDPTSQVSFVNGATLSTTASIISGRTISGSGTINTNANGLTVGGAAMSATTLVGGGTFGSTAVAGTTVALGVLSISAPTTFSIPTAVLGYATSLTYTGTGTETITPQVLSQGNSTIIIASGSTVDFSGGLLASTTTLTGGGTLILSDATAAANKANYFSIGTENGTGTVSGGTLEFAGANALSTFQTASANAISLVAGTLINTGAGADLPRSLVFGNATVSGSAVTFSGAGTVPSGVYNSVVTTSAALEADTDVTFNTSLGDRTTLTSAGVKFAGSGSISLEAGGTFSEALTTGVKTLNVYGALSTPSVNITNGTVNLGTSGTLGAGAVTVASGATLASQNVAVSNQLTVGGTVKGLGTSLLIGGGTSVAAGGFISAPAIYTGAGTGTVLALANDSANTTTTLGADGVTTVNLGGELDDNSVLVVNNGSVAIDGYTEGVAEAILGGVTYSTYGQILDASTPGGFITGTGALQIVPEPGSLSLLAIGAGGLLARRRRRKAMPVA